MKYILSLIAFVFAITFAQAQPPAGNANVGDHYGAETTPDGAVKVDEVPNLLNNKESVNLKVEAKVLDVCPKKGCWVLLETADKSKVFVKMKDYGFFVPTSLIGKTVVVDGEAKSVVTSVDELKHYAKDAKKSQAEIDAIKDPTKEVRLTANGILVVK
jgi:hypothetical protein